MSKELILFVEDNTDFRDSAARFLELSNFEVMVASDGIEALDVLDTTQRIPAVIISDISMPNMNGYEFFEAVRQRPPLKIVPFVFLTAMDARDDFKLGWEVGVDEYLVKPFRPEEFLHVIRNRIRRHEELKALAANQLQNARDSIVKILSHELRTPLTYVTGGFTLLHDEINREDGNLDTTFDRDELQKILQFIRNGTERLNRLAEQTVMLTEITSSQNRQTWERLATQLDIQDLIESAISKLHEFAEDHLVTIETHITSVRTVGVPNLLLVAITEPLRNAIQFSGRGATVVVKSYINPDSPKTVVIEIADQGRGMDEKDINTAWDLMGQVERDKQEQQGFGLGLPLTREVINLHGGQSHLISQKGVGTTVYLRLPITDTF